MLFIELLKAIFFGIVEGITEWSRFPVQAI